MNNPNHHYEYATAAFGSVSSNAHASFNEEARSDALIQATLALAFEQRTANLIAIWQTGEIKDGDGSYGITMDFRMSLYNEIAQRIGVTK